MAIEETTIEYILQSTISGISIICCLIVTIGFIVFKNLRKSALKLVLFLCISEIIYSISMIMRPSNVDNNDLCAAKLFLANLGHLSTLFWSCMISYSLFRSIKYGYDHVKGVINKIIVTSFIVPTALALLILWRQYTFTGNDFCLVLQEGIESTNRNGEDSLFLEKLIMLLEFQIPIYISFIFNLTQVMKVATIAKENNIININQKLKRIYLYPFIVPTCQIFSLIYQVYVLFGGNPHNHTLITLNIIFSSFQGTLNSIIYGFNQKLKFSFKSAYINRRTRSGASTSLSESLVNQVNSSSYSYDSPETKKAAYKHFAKAYQTASEDDDEEDENVQQNSNNHHHLHHPKQKNPSNHRNSHHQIKNNTSNNHAHNSNNCDNSNSHSNSNSNNNKNHNSGNNENRSISEFNGETTQYFSKTRQSNLSQSNKQRFERKQGSESSMSSNNEMSEDLSDDLLDDVLSNHSTPQRQLQLTIADF